MVVELSNSEILMLKFDRQPSQEMLNNIESNYIANTIINNVSSIEYNLLKHKELIKELIVGIKNNPTMTLTQYNNYITTRQWYEQAICNFFLYTIAVTLAERRDVTLSNYTQTVIWTNVRNWIVATSGQIIAKTIFGE